MLTTPSSARYYSGAPAHLSSQATAITQTYSLAHSARRKLAREASRADLHLGRLVGHANLLDSLMLELSRAERQRHLEIQRQQQQPHPYYRPQMNSSCSHGHIQWAECVAETPEDDWDGSDIDSNSDYDSDESEEMEADMVSLTRFPPHQLGSYVLSPTTSSPPASIVPLPVSIPSDDEKEEIKILQLEYTIPPPPPELDDDSDSSEEDVMPPSPPPNLLPTFFPPSTTTTPYTPIHPTPCALPSSDQETDIFDKSYYVPPSSPSTHLISTMNFY